MFPVRPGGKQPAVDRWEQRATADPALVARHWPSDRHNVGIACGPSALVVIDLDTHGELPDGWRLPGVVNGLDVLAVLCERAGQPWPATYTVVTPADGEHLYFAAPPRREIRNSAGRVGPMIDVRGRGGYVLAAGSAVDGRAYEILDDSEPAPLPMWLADLADSPRPRAAPAAPAGDVAAPGRLRAVVNAVLAAKQGERNNVLHWAACRFAELVAAGEITRQQAAGVLVEAAVCTGLPEREAERTVTSALGTGGAT